MTYEPGQQVLVPAVVKGVQPDADPVWVQIPTVFGNRLGWVPAADVVGPAPATPDAGDRFKGVIAFKVDLADGRTLVVDPADVTIVTVNDDTEGRRRGRA